MSDYATPSRDPFPSGCLIFLALALFFLVAVVAAQGEVPRSGVIREHVDVIEWCHYYTETSEGDSYPLQYKPLWTQVIFRNWDYETGEHQIVAWRMVKGFAAEEIKPDILLTDMHNAEMLPQEQAILLERKPRLRTQMAVEWNEPKGLWQMAWFDGDLHRVITAGSFHETHTIGDPEVEERTRWPKEFRKELRKQGDFLSKKP